MARLCCVNGAVSAHPHACLSARTRPQSRHPATSWAVCPHRTTPKNTQRHHLLHATPAASLSPTTLPSDLSSLTVPQLKDHLRQLGLPVSGRKAELIQRIQAAINTDADGGSHDSSNGSNVEGIAESSSTTTSSDGNGVELTIEAQGGQNVDDGSVGESVDSSVGESVDGGKKTASRKGRSRSKSRSRAKEQDQGNQEPVSPVIDTQAEAVSSPPEVTTGTPAGVSVVQDAPETEENKTAQASEASSSLPVRSRRRRRASSPPPVQEQQGQEQGQAEPGALAAEVARTTASEGAISAAAGVGDGVADAAVAGPLSMSEDERRGMASATHIATVATIEAMLEQMGSWDEDEEEVREEESPAVNASVAVPWLKDQTALVIKHDAAAAQQSAQHMQKKETNRPVNAAGESASNAGGPGSALGNNGLQQRDPVQQDNGLNASTSGRQARDETASGMTFSELSAAISKCTSVEAMAALVAAATVHKPLTRLHLCAAIQRLARVAPKDSPVVSPVLHQLVGDLSVQLLDQLHQCDVRALSTLLWSLGRLGFQPVGEFSNNGRVRQLEAGYVSSSVVACLTMMDEFGWRKARAVDLVDILEGLVRLDLKEPELTTDVLNRLRSQLFRADSYCVSHAVWACSKLPQPPMDFISAASRRLARLCYQDMRPFEMSTALAGYVHLGYKDNALLAAMKNRARQVLPSMQAADLSVLCWALASLEDDDTNFLKIVMQHISRRMSPTDLPTRLLVNVTWSAARMSYYSQAWMDSTLAVLVPRVPSMPLSHLVQLLWSVSKLEHFNRQLYDQAAKRLGECLQELDVQAMSSVLWSYAHLGVQSPAFFNAITAHLSQQSSWSSWGAQDLSMAAWSLAVLEVGEGELFKQLMDAASKLGPKSFSVAEQAQIFQMYMKLQEQAVRYEAAVQHMEQQCSALLEASRKAWMRNIADNRHKASRSCYETAGVLSSLGYNVRVEQQTDDGLLSIDIVVQLDDTTQLAVEVDGPSHFTNSNPRRLLGPSISRNKSLEARGWRVVNIPLHKMSAIRSTEERKKWLQQQIEHAHQEILDNQTNTASTFGQLQEELAAV